MIGEWNAVQKFNSAGVLFQICRVDSGHYCILKMVEAKLPEAIVASGPIAVDADALAEAERLRKAALI